MDRPSKLHQLVPMLTTTNPSCWAKYVTATTDPLSASKRRECDLGSWFTGVTAAFAAGFLSPCREHCELVIMGTKVHVCSSHLLLSDLSGTRGGAEAVLD